MSDLAHVTARLRALVNDRDWSQFHSPANLAKSISIESAELLEHFQWDDSATAGEEAQFELADVLIYCLHMCNALQIDPVELMERKLDQVEAKYPVHLSRGTAAKYTELREL